MSKNRSQDTFSVRLNVDSLESRIVPSVTVRFDYSLDPSGMFQNPAMRAELDHAANLITSQLQDSLAQSFPAVVIPGRQISIAPLPIVQSRYPTLQSPLTKLSYTLRQLL